MSKRPTIKNTTSYSTASVMKKCVATSIVEWRTSAPVGRIAGVLKWVMALILWGQMAKRYAGRVQDSSSMKGRRSNDAK